MSVMRRNDSGSSKPSKAQEERKDKSHDERKFEEVLEGMSSRASDTEVGERQVRAGKANATICICRELQFNNKVVLRATRARGMQSREQ